MRAFPRSATLLAACTLVLATGCGTDDEPTAATGSETPPSSAATSTEPEPTPPTTSPSSASPTVSASPASLTDRLLATGEVPGLNASWHWQDGETGPAGADPFGACAKVDLASIGATEVVARSYFPPVDTDDHAAQQVAEFPDTATAARAAKVLASWHAQCRRWVAAQDPTATGVRVRPVTAVDTASGTGTWYLVSWTPKGAEEGRFHAFGTVVDGTRISVLSIDNGGQDYNYPVGKEPMVGMVAAAAEKLG